jgi:hypothetical protein
MSPLQKIKRLFLGCVSVASYLKARLGERSTWAGFVLAVSGAAALTSPWSFVAVACGVVGVLVPEAGGSR